MTELKRLGKTETVPNRRETCSAPLGKWKFPALLMLILLTVAAIVSLTFRLLVGVGKVTETSMAPTVNSGDLVLYSRLDRQAGRGDIVVFGRNGTEYIKRVAAVAGDTVEVNALGIFVNGELLEPPEQAGQQAAAALLSAAAGGIQTVTVPAGSVYVLGDNLGVSLDSRSRELGLVQEEEIEGKLVVRLALGTR